MKTPRGYFPLFSSRAKNLRSPFFVGGLAAATLFFAGCVSEPSAITGEKKSFGYSWEQEIQLGAQADKELTEQMGLYEDPQIQAYVEQVGRRVLQNSDLREATTPELYRETQFTFRVMNSPVVNAFALPGGYVYVTRGLLAHVQNEAQLGVVLGHEIAHVAARHSSQQARREQMSQIGLIAGAVIGQQVLGDRVGDIGSLMNMGSQALGLFLMRYSREAEHESDSLGVTYAKRAGYAAEESAKFFQTLQQLSQTEGQKALPTWQSTHPDPGDRAQRVVQLANSIPAPQGAVPFVGEEEHLRRIDGLIVGDDPREGFVRNGVFYHPVLRFQFPVAPGWKLVNQPSAVLMAEPNGRAVMGLRLAPGTQARQAAATFVQQAGVQVTASGDTAINGLPATVVVGQAQVEQGVIGVWNAFIEFENRVYSLLAYSPAQVFGQLQPTFEAVAGGFGPVRDQAALQVQPTRLRVVRADRNAPFSTFVPPGLPEDIQPREVAILNQSDLNATVQPGRLLKLPAVYPPGSYPAQPAAYPQPAVSPAQPPVAYPAQPTYPAQQPLPPAFPPAPSPTAVPQNQPPPAFPQSQPPATQGPVWPRPATW